MRYSRQELVIGKDAQKKLQQSNVVIVGIGALGTVSAELLCRAGIGSLTLIDRDRVELSNLQRQLLFTEKDCERFKAEVAKEKLSAINSEITVNAHVSDLNYKSVELLNGHDLIIDGTDNLSTRFLIDEYARKSATAWIYAGVIKDHGNVMAITPHSPCFRCTFEETTITDTCDTVGVLGSATALIASLQTKLAIDILSGNKTSQQLINVSLSSLRMNTIKTKKNPDCPVCNGRYEYLKGSKERAQIHYQCSGLYTFFAPELDFEEVKKKLSNLEEITATNAVLFNKEFTLFKSGKIIIKAKTIEHAKATLSKYFGM